MNKSMSLLALMAMLLSPSPVPAGLYVLKGMDAAGKVFLGKVVKP